jgi:predicted PolB exonuclease-like 3'-5' exonuclease
MFKDLKDRVWAFDLEWVPDPLAGRLVYRLSDDLSDLEVLQEMWRRGGATDEEPQPFLKLSLCRVVSVAAVERRARPDGSVNLALMSLPREPDDPESAAERSVVGTFLEALSEHRPQLVGFNSQGSDLPILIQRGLILGVSAPGFCRRPDKPWEGIDYFARGSDWNVDLKDIVGAWGLAAPSLHELAVQSGIPGKMDVDGAAVADLWLADDTRRIVHYNEFDAVTTYLLWLRTAHLAGFFDAAAYAAEQHRLEELVAREIASGKVHLQAYREEWMRLQALVADRDPGSL